MENKEKGYLRLFRDTCKAINSSLNLAKVLNLITENLIAALNVKACTVFLWDRERSILEVIATQGLSESYLKKGPVDWEKETLNLGFRIGNIPGNKHRCNTIQKGPPLAC
jgi:hypothetical protein